MTAQNNVADPTTDPVLVGSVPRLGLTSSPAHPSAGLCCDAAGYTSHVSDTWTERAGSLYSQVATPLTLPSTGTDSPSHCQMLQGRARQGWRRDHRPSDHDAPRRAARAFRDGPQRVMRRSAGPADRATDREVGVVAAVLAAGSKKAAAHRLGLSHSTVKDHLANARSKVGAETTAQRVWILTERLPEPEEVAEAGE